MPKDTVKDKLDGNELDLSMNNLTVIPVKEMASLTKGTRVDLSCNDLTFLPNEFCSLVHIVKLDLSKNKLEILPDDFGDLQKLQHLDLYGNRLSTVPVSCFRLKQLKWLDLRDNPLSQELQSVAGDCNNETECRNCAKRVVAYMRNVQADNERKRQKLLQIQREQETARKKEDEKERQIKKAEKLVQKERRRKEFEAKKAEEVTLPGRENQSSLETHNQTEKLSNGTSTTVRKKDKGGWSCCGIVMILFFSVITLFMALYFYCESHQKNTMCLDVKKIMLPYIKSVESMVSKYVTFS